jgi:hypothetical protein
MFRLFVLIFFIFTPVVQSAQGVDYYRDWRLEHPFVHGLTVVASLGLVDTKPDEWNKAHPLDPAGIPAGMIQYLERHKVIPFTAGISFGLIAWFYLLFCIIYRVKNKLLIATYRYHQRMEQDDEYRKQVCNESSH